MTMDCDKCGFPVPINMIPSRCGALEFESQCPHCGIECSGALTIKQAPAENEDLSIQMAHCIHNHNERLYSEPSE